MHMIWGHVSPEPMTRPELKNINLTFWAIQKTLLRFSGHVRPPELVYNMRGYDQHQDV